MATLSSDKGLRDTKFRVSEEDFFEEFCEESFVDPVEVDVIDESLYLLQRHRSPSQSDALSTSADELQLKLC